MRNKEAVYGKRKPWSRAPVAGRSARQSTQARSWKLGSELIHPRVFFLFL